MTVLGAALVAALVVAVVVAVGIAGHPEQIRAAGRRITDLPPLRRLADEADRRGCLALPARRLGLEPTAALLLLLGLLAVASLGVLFTYLLDGVLDGEGVAHVDQPASQWLAVHREPALTAVMRAITQVGSPPALAAMAGVFGVIAAWAARSWLPAVLAVITAGGIGLMILGVKALIERPRPPHPYAVLTAAGWSFPSGHAAGTAAIALVSAWALTRWTVRSWAAQVVVWTLALLLAAAVGLSRIYLGVHYVSDVLAGWVLGVLWAGVVALAGAWWHRSTALHRPNRAGHTGGRDAELPRSGRRTPARDADGRFRPGR